MWLTEDTVERIVSTLTRMRGAALKLGQMISMQGDNIFPPEVERIFERVRDGASFMPAWQMNLVMKEELGERWREKFERFDEIPVAAASIGQVHRGKLRTGEEIAIKIQYPGVAKSIVSDLENLKSLLMFSQLLPKGLFLESTTRVAQRELMWECDYRREASFMKIFRDFMQLNKNFAFIVPRVYEELSTSRVLVSDYFPGIPISKFVDASQEERDDMGRRIVWLCLQEIFNLRCMQTDPNWSNFLKNHDDPSIILLDFGSARGFSDEFVKGYAQIIRAAANQDQDSIIEHSKRLGFLTGDETKSMIDAHVRAILALSLPFRYPGLYDFGNASQEVTSQVRALIPTMLNHRLTPPPEESYSLHRKLSGIFLLCTRLKARIDCHQLLDQSLNCLDR